MSLEIQRGHDGQVNLTELERDALAELANIGVSRAAANLRKMVGKQVLLSVPSVEVVNQKTAAALVGEREGDKLVAVRQTFSGSFSGRALLIFPQAKSLELIRAITGEAGAEDIEDEALAETGNIILNGCLATMANILRQTLTISLPEVVRGSGVGLFEVKDSPDDRRIGVVSVYQLLDPGPRCQRLYRNVDGPSVSRQPEGFCWANSLHP